MVKVAVIVIDQEVEQFLYFELATAQPASVDPYARVYPKYAAPRSRQEQPK